MPRRIDEVSGIDETIVIPSPSEFLCQAPIDPWHRFSSLREDAFILVEFSEVEGPRPILQMPDKQHSHFDLNELCVRIMTADYQSNNRSQFLLRKDMQMIQTNAEQGIHTYAHYFTLFDIEARGYVRPYCIGYVSRDKRKLIHLFDEIRTELSGIVEKVKMCNRRLFLNELACTLDALQGVENQAISSYYELCYGVSMKVSDEASCSSAPANQFLNIRYMRLHQELSAAFTQIKQSLEDGSTSACSNSHCASFPDLWIAAIKGDVLTEKPPLRELRSLCSCTYDGFVDDLRKNLLWLQNWSLRSQFCSTAGSNAIGVSFGGSLLFSIERPPPPEILHGGFGALPQPEAHNGPKVALAHHRQDEIHDPNLHQKDLLLSLLPKLPQLLYGLLTGKVFLVFGSNQRKDTVMAFVNKLQNFIPLPVLCPMTEPFSCWNEGHISASVFSEHRMMGQMVNKGDHAANLVPENFKPYLCFIDLNSDTLSSPKYSGSWLKKITHKRGLFPSDDALIAAIKALLLSDLCSLSYVLFYFIYADLDAYRRNCRHLKEFAHKLGIEGSDFRIVRHFAELIKTQFCSDEVELSFSGLQECLVLEKQDIQVMKL